MQPGSNWPEPVAVPAAESERPAYPAHVSGPASYEPPAQPPPEKPRSPSRSSAHWARSGLPSSPSSPSSRRSCCWCRRSSCWPARGRCSSRSRPTRCCGAGSSQSASSPSCSCTKWVTSSSCAARASRPACRCSSRSWARSFPPGRSATTHWPRPASASPGRSSAASARPHHRGLACDRERLFRALAYIGFFLNLFNLLPVVPLDGGRAMAAMAPWMWFVGFAALIPLLFVFLNPIFVIIILFAGRETWTRWQRRATAERRAGLLQGPASGPRARRRGLPGVHRDARSRDDATYFTRTLA